MAIDESKKVFSDLLPKRSTVIYGIKELDDASRSIVKQIIDELEEVYPNDFNNAIRACSLSIWAGIGATYLYHFGFAKPSRIAEVLISANGIEKLDEYVIQLTGVSDDIELKDIVFNTAVAKVNSVKNGTKEELTDICERLFGQGNNYEIFKLGVEEQYQLMHLNLERTEEQEKIMRSPEFQTKMEHLAQTIVEEERQGKSFEEICIVSAVTKLKTNLLSDNDKLLSFKNDQKIFRTWLDDWMKKHPNLSDDHNVPVLMELAEKSFSAAVFIIYSQKCLKKSAADFSLEERTEVIENLKKQAGTTFINSLLTDSCLDLYKDKIQSFLDGYVRNIAKYSANLCLDENIKIMAEIAYYAGITFCRNRAKIKEPTPEKKENRFVSFIKEKRGIFVIIAIVVLLAILFIVFRYGVFNDSSDFTKATTTVSTTKATQKTQASTKETTKAPTTTEVSTSTDPALTPVTVRNSEILKWPSDERVAPLAVNTTMGENYYIVLEEVSASGRNDMSFFVKGGNAVTMKIPLGTYEIYYAVGSTWYGTEDKFGPDTKYYKCEGYFKFYEDVHGYNGYTLTLYKVTNGNMDTEVIDEADFPG